ncbi:hypothetical protein BXZ70DRAFT_165025 [Cristinia sonorae]|uniref:DNA-binding protein RAP1 n=1 Tax=Cristinia sonorae TaxID=1940300 RepID=A0A8K0UPW2_9AGAR|nr:hypothetical protein BXZ70DRAFT_165025 [Cristinia sonorae]
MPIFQDESGLAVKFFIQKDIPEDIQAEVCETIASLGGRVESKVPRAGYVLVQPGTTEEERLRLCWATRDRPDRYFVPYTYVDACKISGMLLKQIFLEDGQPIRMHIDSSIANVNVRSILSARIMHSGGDPTASAQAARVILADPNTEVFQHLVKTYQGETDKYVESYLWVKKCIERGSVVFTPVVYKNPGGRRPGEERTQFTEQDEEHLCNWIAAKIPYKETGGRTGNRLYQQLCELRNEPEFAWVSRHTWQSWRERYKKNASRLDVRIAQIVEEKKPALGEKGQYGYVRQAEVKPKRTRKKSRKSEGEDSEVLAGPSNQDTEHFSVPAPVPIPVSYQQQSMPQPPDAPPPSYPTLLYAPSFPLHPPPPMQINRPPLDPILARQNAPEQEMEDGEEDIEWPIRIGHGPPPAWAKRRREYEEEEPSKRSRGSPEERESSASEAGNGALVDIARRYRFTVEEVQEYHNKSHDLERTERRFCRMRQVLMEMKDEDDVEIALEVPQSQSTQSQR